MIALTHRLAILAFWEMNNSKIYTEVKIFLKD